MQNKAFSKLLESVIAELLRGIDLMNRIDTAIYTRASVRSGSVGAQFRHNLDFVNGFLKGLRSGKVDYERRERDPRIETDRRYAAAKFAAAIGELRKVRQTDLEKAMLVRSEADEELFHLSTGVRELEFMLSHTVHHHALIAEKLDAAGLSVARELGVAPSTLKFWERERINSMAA